MPRSKRTDYEKSSFFERLKLGLEQSIAFSRGELRLKTTTLSRPRPLASPSPVATPRHTKKTPRPKGRG